MLSHAAPQSPPPLTRSRAHAYAWLVAGLVNAIFIAALPMPASGLPTRVLHHVYDFGHFVALAWASGIVMSLWGRLPAVWQRRRWVVLAVASFTLGLAIIPEDAALLARRVDVPPVVLTAAIVLVVSMTVPGAAIVGAVARGRSAATRWAAVGLAVAVLCANNIVLHGEHRSAHAFVSWAAVVLLGTVLTGSPFRSLPVPPFLTQTIRAASAGVAVWTVVTVPAPVVHVELIQLDGAVLVSPLARLRDPTRGGELPAAAVPPGLVSWFGSRDGASAIPASEPPLVPADAIVIFVTLDAVPARLLNDEEYRERLPRLWALRDHAVSFTNARSPGSGTRNTLGSVFTGKYRTQLDWRLVRRRGYTLRTDPTTQLVESLTTNGIDTQHAIAYVYLRRRFAVLKGFQREHPAPPMFGRDHALAGRVLRPLLRHIESRPRGPLFLFAHLMDAHEPYNAAGVEGSPRTRHLGEVALYDKAVGELWDTVVARGLRDRVVLIVAADHGEAFGEHNTRHHQTTVYDELVRVPLMIIAPGARPREIPDAVTLLDIGPTVLDLFRLATPGHYMGQSLVPYLQGEDVALTRPIAGLTTLGDANVYYYYLPDSNTKVIWNTRFGTREIYELDADPLELTNVYSPGRPLDIQRMALLQTFFRQHRSR